MAKNNPVTKEMLIMDVLNEYPEVTPVLMGYGLHCIGCRFSSYDTIEAGAKIHGLSDEVIDMMVGDINLIIEKFHNAESAGKED